MLIIFARIKALSPFSVSIGTLWGWKSLTFWFPAFVSLIKNKGIMDKKKQFHLVLSSQQVLLFAWILLHFIKLYFCLSLQHRFSRRAHCSPFCNNMCFLISLVFAKWAWNFSLACLISEFGAETKSLPSLFAAPAPSCRLEPVLANVGKTEEDYITLLADFLNKTGFAKAA